MRILRSADEIVASLREKPTASTDKPTLEPVIPSTRWRKFYLGLDETNPEIRKMALAVELWSRGCLQDDPKGRLLVLYGKLGTGKTTAALGGITGIQRHAVEAWSDGRWRRDNPARADWWSWSDLANLGPEYRSERSSWPEAVSHDAILLDDVGSEPDQFKSGVPIENLRIILEARRGKWTCITTNVPKQSWSEDWDARVESRLHENAVHVEIKTAPDWRKLTTESSTR